MAGSVGLTTPSQGYWTLIFSAALPKTTVEKGILAVVVGAIVAAGTASIACIESLKGRSIKVLALGAVCYGLSKLSQMWGAASVSEFSKDPTEASTAAKDQTRSTVFAPLTVKEIYSKDAIKVLDSSTFSELSNLEFVSLNVSNFSTLPGDLFANNPKLKTICLYTDGQIFIPSNLFKNNSQVTQVRLGCKILASSSNEHLLFLPPDLFSNNLQLKEVQLICPGILSFSPDLFENLKLRALRCSEDIRNQIPDHLKDLLDELWFSL